MGVYIDKANPLFPLATVKRGATPATQSILEVVDITTGMDKRRCDYHEAMLVQRAMMNLVLKGW